jgi:hypothetical protein
MAHSLVRKLSGNVMLNCIVALALLFLCSPQHSAYAQPNTVTCPNGMLLYIYVCIYMPYMCLSMLFSSPCLTSPPLLLSSSPPLLLSSSPPLLLSTSPPLLLSSTPPQLLTGLYSFVSRDSSCQPCPQGGICDSTTQSILTSVNYWRDARITDDRDIASAKHPYYVCVTPGACCPNDRCSVNATSTSSSSSMNQCGANRQDVLCGECTDDHIVAGRECVLCKHSSIVSLLLSIIVLIIFCVLSVKMDIQKHAYFLLLFFVMQNLPIVLQYRSIRDNDTNASDMYRGVLVLNAFNFDFNAAFHWDNLYCLDPTWSNIQNVRVQFIASLLPAILLMLSHTMMRLCHSFSFENAKMTAQNLLLLCYTPLLRASLALVHCRYVPTSKSWVLSSSTATECYSSSHSPWIFIGYVSLGIFGIAIPIMWFIHVRRTIDSRANYVIKTLLANPSRLTPMPSARAIASTNSNQIRAIGGAGGAAANAATVTRTSTLGSGDDIAAPGGGNGQFFNNHVLTMAAPYVTPYWMFVTLVVRALIVVLAYAPQNFFIRQAGIVIVLALYSAVLAWHQPLKFMYDNLSAVVVTQLLLCTAILDVFAAPFVTDASTLQSSTIVLMVIVLASMYLYHVFAHRRKLRRITANGDDTGDNDDDLDAYMNARVSRANSDLRGIGRDDFDMESDDDMSTQGNSAPATVTGASDLNPANRRRRSSRAWRRRRSSTHSRIANLVPMMQQHQYAQGQAKSDNHGSDDTVSIEHTGDDETATVYSKDSSSHFHFTEERIIHVEPAARPIDADELEQHTSNRQHGRHDHVPYRAQHDQADSLDDAKSDSSAMYLQVETAVQVDSSSAVTSIDQSTDHNQLSTVADEEEDEEEENDHDDNQQDHLQLPGMDHGDVELISNSFNGSNPYSSSEDSHIRATQDELVASGSTPVWHVDESGWAVGDDASAGTRESKEQSGPTQELLQRIAHSQMAMGGKQRGQGPARGNSGRGGRRGRGRGGRGRGGRGRGRGGTDGGRSNRARTLPTDHNPAAQVALSAAPLRLASFPRAASQSTSSLMATADAYADTEQQRQSVFDRLNDPTNFTGVHRRRHLDDDDDHHR